jgi:hypothetical protein
VIRLVPPCGWSRRFHRHPQEPSIEQHERDGLKHVVDGVVIEVAGVDPDAGLLDARGQQRDGEGHGDQLPTGISGLHGLAYGHDQEQKDDRRVEADDRPVGRVDQHDRQRERDAVHGADATPDRGRDAGRGDANGEHEQRRPDDRDRERDRHPGQEPHARRCPREESVEHRAPERGVRQRAHDEDAAPGQSSRRRLPRQLPREPGAQHGQAEIRQHNVGVVDAHSPRTCRARTGWSEITP